MAVLMLFFLGTSVGCAVAFVVLVVAIIQDPAVLLASVGRAKSTPVWIALIGTALGAGGAGWLFLSNLGFMKELLVGRTWVSRRRR